jgi:hypothetical protein
MEEILVNIDSKYRDITVYPQESKYSITFEKKFKNIISVRMLSLEITNTINYINSTKNNNFFYIHLPNQANDPDGIKFQLEDGLLQVIGSIRNIVNILFSVYTNTNGALQQYTVDGKPFAEKYFYFFYLNDAVTFTFDFNSELFPSDLSQKLTLKAGWYSVFGLYYQIWTYVEKCSEARIKYINQNPTRPAINFDSGNFTMEDFSLRVWDRRFRNLDASLDPTSNDCIRVDNIIMSDQTYNVNDNILFKNKIYSFYIEDTINYVPFATGTGILDKLIGNNYIIPPTYVGANGTKTYESNSIYNLNNNTAAPSTDSIQIYHLMMQINNISFTVSFENKFTTDATAGVDYYYYWVDLEGGENTWRKLDATTNLINNRLANLTSKTFLRKYKFITLDQFNDPYYLGTLVKDIAPFELDFNTYNKLLNPVDNGIINIKNMQYPPLGFYIGFRPDLKKSTNQFLLTSVIDDTKVTIKAPKIYDATGDDYIFVRINDWGYVDYFGTKMFAKIVFSSGLGNSRLDDFINKEFRFRQPTNVQRLNIELVDYLGNTVDLNGFDWSFTLELKEVLNTESKETTERQGLVFTNR